MAVFSSKLEFDLDKMRDFKKEVVNIKRDLNELKKQVSVALEELEKDWDTPTGRKFLEEELGDWEGSVKQYTNLLGILEKIMQAVIENYEVVEEKASAIRCI